jgi:arsenate reductase (thioredoxin)
MMKSRVRTSLSLAFIVAACAASGVAQADGEETVVFVCEHGAAKSVIATAYFNKLATERGLPDRATYRGANPQAELSVSALRGLRDDGLAVSSAKPSPIRTGDVTKATHIFAIGCSLPAHAASNGKAESWEDVPEDQGYAAERDAIKKHVERLLDQLHKR